MKRVSLLVAVTALLLLPNAAHAQQSESAKDEEAIRQVVQYYLDGITNGDIGSMKKAFHPKAKYFVIRYGGLEEISQERVYRNMRDNIRRQSEKDPAPKRVVSVDVTGEAATAKVEMDYSNGRFTEYLSLVKFADGWKVVSKVMSGAQRQVALK